MFLEVAGEVRDVLVDFRGFCEDVVWVSCPWVLNGVLNGFRGY